MQCMQSACVENEEKGKIRKERVEEKREKVIGCLIWWDLVDSCLAKVLSRF